MREAACGFRIREAGAPIVADLGRWGGRARLVAEYDPEADAIRVDARAIEAVRAALGDDEATRFVAFATEHERFHRAHPGGNEADAHAHARAATGGDARRYEAVLAATFARSR